MQKRQNWKPVNQLLKNITSKATFTPSETRKDWLMVQLGDVCNKASKVKKKTMPPTDSFIYLDIGGIDNKINQIKEYKSYNWENAPSRAQQLVKHEDVLFSTVRTYLKNIAFVSDMKYENQICSSGFTVIRGKKGILNSKFIFYISIFEGFLKPLNELQTGTSYPAVKDSDVLSKLYLLLHFLNKKLLFKK